MAKRMIGIWGYYGFANTGDEAILHCLLGGLRKLPEVRDNAELYVFSAEPETTRRIHQVNSVISSIPRTLKDRLRTVLDSDLRAAGKVYQRLDTFIVGGGGLFFDHPSSNFYLLRLLNRIRLAVEEGKQVILCGVGVGPLFHQESKDIIRSTFSAVQAVLVRDEPSARLLSEIGVTAPVHVTGDLVFLIEPASANRIAEIVAAEGLKKTNRPVIGVSLQGTEAEKPDTWETLRAFTQYAIDRLEADIWFVPMQTGGGWDDRPAAARLAAEIGRPDRISTVNGIYTPWETQGLLNGCDAVMAIRLHGAILAMVNHTPVFGLAYAPKVSRVFAELGHEDWQVAIEEATPERVCEGFTRIWQNRPQVRAELAGLMAAARNRAEENFRLLAGYLQKETSPEPIWQNQNPS